MSTVEDDRDMDAVHSRVRDMILRGELRPGQPVSQIQLASRLGVSRTPLREALRRLQEEGLITSAKNRRAEVAVFDAAALEHVYSRRIMMEGLGVALTVQRLTPRELTEMEELLAIMDADDERWETAHRRFHRLLLSHAPSSHRSEADRLHDWSDMYRRLYAVVLRGGPHRRPVANAEHRNILNACRAGDVDLAVSHLGRHLGRTALTLLAQLAPHHDPSVVRTALRIVADARSDSEFTELMELPRA